MMNAEDTGGKSSSKSGGTPFAVTSVRRLSFVLAVLVTVCVVEKVGKLLKVVEVAGVDLRRARLVKSTIVSGRGAMFHFF